MSRQLWTCFFVVNILKQKRGFQKTIDNHFFEESKSAIFNPLPFLFEDKKTFANFFVFRTIYILKRTLPWLEFGGFFKPLLAPFLLVASICGSCWWLVFLPLEVGMPDGGCVALATPSSLSAVTEAIVVDHWLGLNGWLSSTA